ncbi:uncharacterized protein TNCV_3592021 [Trichonephila clavipes]|nr:uncharacterized protein TNCV_3592021 [Trichonephila clavipes]
METLCCEPGSRNPILTDPNSWFHCSGKDNPADLLTRGISVDALTTNSKWWNGSSFLRQIDFQTKGLAEAIPERVYLTEMRKNSNPKEDISLTLTVTKKNFLENIIDISNNYVKLIHVEVSHAENWLIHSLHEREFYEEMRKLLAGTLVLIKDENLPSTKWSTGRITEIFPGTDGTIFISVEDVQAKIKKSPERPSKNLVPELLPAFEAPNAEVCLLKGTTLKIIISGRTDPVRAIIYWTSLAFLCHVS